MRVRVLACPVVRGSSPVAAGAINIKIYNARIFKFLFFFFFAAALNYNGCMRPGICNDATRRAAAQPVLRSQCQTLGFCLILVFFFFLFYFFNIACGEYNLWCS